MADSLTTRVARIIAGGAHALLDKAEGVMPDAAMMQSIREIDQVAAEMRTDLGKAEAARHLVLSQIGRLEAEHARLDESIEAAIVHQRDELARAAIGRQTDIEDLLPVLRKTRDEQSERSSDLESNIVALQAKKRELEQLLDDYRASMAGANGTAAVAGLADSERRLARVEDAAASFERVLGRQLGAGGVASGGKLGDAVKLHELAELQRDNRISERLAARKAARKA